MQDAAPVSMLWEAVDVAQVLRERFGFADAHRAEAWLRETFRLAWGREVERVDRIVLSASNLLAWVTADGRKTIAKCCVDSSRFAKLIEVDAILAKLGDEGFPVAAPIPGVSGLGRVERQGLSVALYPVVDGELLDVTDGVQVEAAGRTFATLHRILQHHSVPVGHRDDTHGSQLVHNDFRSANILYADTEISAVLDFEEMTHGTRIGDLARSAVLLATRYHDWEPTSPAVRDTFVDAYAELWPLSRDAREQLDRSIAEISAQLGWS